MKTRRFAARCGRFLAGAAVCLSVPPLSSMAERAYLYDRGPAPYAVDGHLKTNREQFGYYPPKWRPWPGTAEATGAGGRRPTQLDLEESVVPPPEVEDQAAPTGPAERKKEDSTIAAPPPKDEPPEPSPDLGDEPPAPPGDMGSSESPSPDGELPTRRTPKAGPGGLRPTRPLGTSPSGPNAAPAAPGGELPPLDGGLFPPDPFPGDSSTRGTPRHAPGQAPMRTNRQTTNHLRSATRTSFSTDTTHDAAYEKAAMVAAMAPGASRSNDSPTAHQQGRSQATLAEASVQIRDPRREEGEFVSSQRRSPSVIDRPAQTFEEPRPLAPPRHVAPLSSGSPSRANPLRASYQLREGSDYGVRPAIHEQRVDAAPAPPTTISARPSDLMANPLREQ